MIMNNSIYINTFIFFLQARDDTTLSCGRPSQIASTAYQLQPLLMKKYSVVMAVGHCNSCVNFHVNNKT